MGQVNARKHKCYVKEYVQIKSPKKWGQNLSEDISKEEIVKAILAMENGKSRGADGILVEFYKANLE